MSALLDPPRTEPSGAPSGPDGPRGGGTTPTAPPTTPATLAAWVAILALVAGVVLAPPTGGAFASGDFGRLVAGTLQVRDGDGWAAVPVGGRVSQGARVRTVDEHAELEVRGGQLLLARWSELGVDGDHLDLARGELLLDADRSYDVQYGALVGSGRGTWRVNAKGTVRYAVYDGGIGLRQPGEDEPVVVGPLREVTLTEGATDGVRPLAYLPSDPWDARLLAEAIRIDRLLAATQRGLAVRYGGEPQPAAFYGDFARFEGLLDQLPELAVVAEDDRYGPPAETLVALVVAELLVADAQLDPDVAAARIDELRAAGAEWGLIVREHGLAADDLDRTIERAVRQRGEAVAEGTAAPVLSPPAPPAPAPQTPPATPSPPATPPTEEPPSSPPGEDPDPPEDEPGPLDPVTDPVTDTVTDTVDDLGSLLDEVVPGASDVTDAVNEVVEDVVDLLP